MFPIFLDLAGRPCLVVGGGTVALRKIQSLLSEKAKVTVVSPVVIPEIRELAARGEIRWHQRLFVPTDVDGMALVFCTTNRRSVNQRVATAARRHRVLVNVADDPENCDFFLGSVVKRGPISVAISSSGRSPALTSHLKRELGPALPPHVAAVAEALGSLRSEVQQHLPDAEARTRFWHRAVKHLLSSANRQLQQRQAEQILRDMLRETMVPEERP